MKTRKPPLEASYYDGTKYQRIHFHEIDRENINSNVGDSMRLGRLVFTDAKGAILASCEPTQLSWVRANQAK